MWPARPSMKARLNLPAAGWLNPGSGVGYGFFKGFFGSLLSWRWILRWLYQSEKACRTSLIFHFSFRVLHKRTFIIEFFRCLGNTLPLAGLWRFFFWGDQLHILYLWLRPIPVKTGGPDARDNTCGNQPPCFAIGT